MENPLFRAGFAWPEPSLALDRKAGRNRPLTFKTAPRIMPHIESNGIQMYYEERGSGDPVIMIMGITAPGGVWEAHADDCVQLRIQRKQIGKELFRDIQLQFRVEQQQGGSPVVAVRI